MTTVLVTGARGFIGRAVCAEFVKRGWNVRAAVRTSGTPLPGISEHVVGDLRSEPRWPLDDVQAVVHLAALVHQVRRKAAEDVYHAVNCAATERLARAAARAGVRRFVYMSSIKVNGERTPINHPFRPGDLPGPQDAYARSKWHGEMALARLSAETGIETAILRPPLVYGPGVRANFLSLMRLLERGMPLPLGAVRNRRSLIYVGNLADLVAAAACSPLAAGKTLFASDGDDVSTPGLVREIAATLHVPARLFPVPVALLKILGRVTGMAAQVGRLVDSLVVDIEDTKRVLGWQPPFTRQAGLQATADWYREGRPGAMRVAR